MSYKRFVIQFNLRTEEAEDGDAPGDAGNLWMVNYSKLSNKVEKLLSKLSRKEFDLMGRTNNESEIVELLDHLLEDGGISHNYKIPQLPWRIAEQQPKQNPHLVIKVHENYLF